MFNAGNSPFWSSSLSSNHCWHFHLISLFATLFYKQKFLFILALSYQKTKITVYGYSIKVDQKRLFGITVHNDFLARLAFFPESKSNLIAWLEVLTKEYADFPPANYSSNRRKGTAGHWFILRYQLLLYCTLIVIPLIRDTKENERKKKPQLLWNPTYLTVSSSRYYSGNTRTERRSECKEQPAWLRWSLSLTHWRNCSETVRLYETWPL